MSKRRLFPCFQEDTVFFYFGFTSVWPATEALWLNKARETLASRVGVCKANLFFETKMFVVEFFKFRFFNTSCNRQVPDTDNVKQKEQKQETILHQNSITPKNKLLPKISVYSALKALCVVSQSRERKHLYD